MADLQDSIAFLQKANANGHNLYDHLSDVLLKLLETKPANAYDVFEHLSVDVKKASFNSPASEQVSVVPESNFTPIETQDNIKLARVQINLLKSDSKDPEVDDQGLPLDGEVPNLLEEGNALEWAGVGLTREDLYRLQISIQQLADTQPLQRVRLFGKIFGLQRDYIVVESEFRDGEGDILPGTPPPEKPVQKKSEDDSDEEGEGQEGEEKVQSPPPTLNLPQEPIIPSEEFTGANKYVYWVCHDIGEEWERLPNVTPAQIVTARKIHKYLTGDLNADVKSCPAFPGKERNYLRAQIARIAAATSVCPKGYLVMEDEDEEGADEDVVLVNDPDFVGHPPAVMMDLGNWVHQTEYILPQGRCSYYRIPKHHNDEDEEEEAYEEEEEEDEDEGEVGPRILTEISADAPIGNSPAWLPRLSHQFGKRPTVAFVKSIRWPGAYCVAYGSKYTNIYIGYGVKSIDRFTPILPPLPQPESTDPNEENDPTLEEEQEVQRQHEAAMPQEGEEGEEGEDEDEELEGEEGEEDGEEYDDEQ